MEIVQLHQLSEWCQHGRLLTDVERFANLMEKVSKPLYTQKEVLGLLGVSPNTLKKYRENGYIGYSRIDDKYYYSKADIDEFLKNTHYPAWHYQQ